MFFKKPFILFCSWIFCPIFQSYSVSSSILTHTRILLYLLCHYFVCLQWTWKIIRLYIKVWTHLPCYTTILQHLNYFESENSSLFSEIKDDIKGIKIELYDRAHVIAVGRDILKNKFERSIATVFGTASVASMSKELMNIL